MENIKLELIYWLENLDKVDIKIKNKLQFALKYYLSRASSTVRNPKLIQQNHYLQDVYSTNHSNSRNIIYSPTKVSFPISAFVNCELINDIESKLFMIDERGNIQIHILEHIIPVLFALFSGPSFSEELTYNGSLLLASLILSTEIDMKLSKLELSDCRRKSITTVLIVSTLMSIKRESLECIIEKLLKSDRECSVRECLELVSMAKYPPTHRNQKTGKEVQRLLAIFDRPFQARDTPMALENMFFCLPYLSPLSSVVTCSLSHDIFQCQFKKISLSINSNLCKGLLSHILGNSPINSIEIDNNIRWLLATSIVLCRTENCQDLGTALSKLYDTESLETAHISDTYEKISVTIVTNEVSLMTLDVIHYNDPSLNEHIVLDHDYLKRSLNKIGSSSLEEHLQLEMVAVIGYHYAKETSDKIDDLVNQGSVRELLAPFFEYPGLD